MAQDTSLADLRKRIVDELQEPALLPQITNAIQDACDFYRRDPFFQSDGTAEFVCTIGQAYYSTPANCKEIRALYTVDAGQKYEVSLRSFEYISALDSNVTSPVTGAPIYYCRFLADPTATPDTSANVGEQQVGGDQIRLFPHPDQPYPMEVDMVRAVPVPVNDGDSNFWTTDGRDMIRSFAKFLIRTNVKPNPELAQMDRALADDYFKRLKMELGMKKFTGRIKQHW